MFDLSGNVVAMIKDNDTFHIVNPEHLSESGEGFVCDTNGLNYVDIESPITITGLRIVAEGVAQ